MKEVPEGASFILNDVFSGKYFSILYWSVNLRACLSHNNKLPLKIQQ